MNMQVFLSHFMENEKKPLEVQFYSTQVSCGFPSPAEDYLDKTLDLNEHLIKRPSATFMVKALGDSMVGAGILPGDLLIIDRSVTAKSGDIILATLQGEFTIKRFIKKAAQVYLMPENPAYQRIIVTEEMDFEVWGVVIHAIHSFKR